MKDQEKEEMDLEIEHFRSLCEERHNNICELQKEMFKEMQKENGEGNLYSARLYLGFINKLQKILDYSEE